ncbi:MAG: response regulator transcription factor [Clostridiales bacterium]|jgi:DNA-binding response OmpR family regulator|nr:response regulator transcription factor [Clostridiales bacterium]
MKQKILVADDEKRIRDLLSDLLEGEGFSVVLAEDGREALEQFEANPDLSLAVLDVMMPFVNGWKVCKEIRTTSRLPIIMLTARSEEADELESFEKGANDYVPKPFSLMVLLARIKARLASEAESGGGIHEGDLNLDTTTHIVTVDGAPVELTPTEYELLLFLSKSPGKVFSREQLLLQVWGYEYYGGDRTVDTHVGRLRLKLGKCGEKYIKTVRGYGYKYEA